MVAIDGFLTLPQIIARSAPSGVHRLCGGAVHPLLSPLAQQGWSHFDILGVSRCWWRQVVLLQLVKVCSLCSWNVLVLLHYLFLLVANFFRANL